MPLMANRVFRFYASSPETVFDPLRRHWRSAVVRWDGRKIGPYRMWLMVIVLDNDEAATWFDRWLEQNGRRENLRLESEGRPPIEVADTIVVRKRLPLWRSFLHLFRSPYEEQKA